MMKQFKWLPLAAFLLQACGSQLIPENTRLVVYFVVDQMPAELIQRIESEFTGGFKWLLDQQDILFWVQDDTRDQQAYWVILGMFAN